MSQKISSKADRSSASYDETSASVSEKAARAFGVLFILLGLVLIVLLIGGFVTSKLPYRVDPTLPIPTLDKLDAYTKDDLAEIKGTALPGEEVVLYIDDNRTRTTVKTDDDGAFTFSGIKLSEEGEISFSAAVIRGGIFKRRSELSNTVATKVDWTAPSSVVSFDYEETSNSNKTSIKGTAEPNTKVILDAGEKTYEAMVDEDGMFTLENIPLSEGDNTFSVRVKDLAGNEVRASKKVQIAYSMGSINGNGASTGVKPSLPESAGELEAAMEFLEGNRLMSVIAFIVIIAFGASASSAYLLAKKSGR